MNADRRWSLKIPSFSRSVSKVQGKVHDVPVQCCTNSKRHDRRSLQYREYIVCSTLFCRCLAMLI